MGVTCQWKICIKEESDYSEAHSLKQTHTLSVHKLGIGSVYVCRTMLWLMHPHFPGTPKWSPTTHEPAWHGSCPGSLKIGNCLPNWIMNFHQYTKKCRRPLCILNCVVHGAPLILIYFILNCRFRYPNAAAVEEDSMGFHWLKWQLCHKPISQWDPRLNRESPTAKQ